MMSFRRLGFGWRVAILTMASALVNLALNSPTMSVWLRGWVEREAPRLEPGEAAYIAFVCNALLIGLSLTVLVLFVVMLEKPESIREYFKLGPIDWMGLGMIALLTFILDGLEAAFLRPMIYEPLRRMLLSVGLWGEPSLQLGFTPDPGLAALNVLLVFLIFWIEVPEEIYFRGYVQNHLQDSVGPNWAMFLGAVIWAAWHLFAIAEFFRILVMGLAFSLVFRLRQNTTPLAIWHPLGNRLLLLFYIASPLLRR